MVFDALYDDSTSDEDENWQWNLWEELKNENSNDEWIIVEKDNKNGDFILASKTPENQQNENEDDDEEDYKLDIE